MIWFTTILILNVLTGIEGLTWSSWGIWSDCAKTCGVSIQTHERVCSLPATCEGSSTESRFCFITPCISYDDWNPWGEWSSCSKSCGTGQRSRDRTCPTNNCEGQNNTMVEECVTGCRMSECSVFSPYDSNFEETDKYWLFDNTGHWRVSKSTPSVSTGPSYDHTFPHGCGHFAYMETSLIPANTVSYMSTGLILPSDEPRCFSVFVSMYSKYPSHMGSLHIYIVNNETNYQTLLWHHTGVLTNNDNQWKQVNIPILPMPAAMIFSILFKATKGPYYNSDIAIDDGKLVNGNCNGTVDGNWANWGDWNNCNVTCGSEGTEFRTRNCSSPAPHNDGEDCVGVEIEERPCVGSPPCPIHGNWTNWTNWTECSATCANGTRYRLRECADPYPLHGGESCTLTNGSTGFEEEETEICAPVVCAMDGGWGEWIDVTVCSKTCREGTLIQEQHCDNPEPAADGHPCKLDEPVDGVISGLYQNRTVSCNAGSCQVGGENFIARSTSTPGCIGGFNPAIWHMDACTPFWSRKGALEYGDCFKAIHGRLVFGGPCVGGIFIFDYGIENFKSGSSCLRISGTEILITTQCPNEDKFYMEYIY